VPGSVVVLSARVGPIGLPVGTEKTVRMPRLAGATLAEAASELEKMGLAWRTPVVRRLPATSACDLFSALEVRDQRPAPGTRFEQTELLSGQSGQTRARTTPVRLVVGEKR
jgi:beta-lactam-binding protein with PASTA domain